MLGCFLLIDLVILFFFLFGWYTPDMELLIWWNLYKDSPSALWLCYLSRCSRKKCNFYVKSFVDLSNCIDERFLSEKSFYLSFIFNSMAKIAFGHVVSVLSLLFSFSDPLLVSCILEQYCCIWWSWCGGFHMGYRSCPCSIEIRWCHGRWLFNWYQWFWEFVTSNKSTDHWFKQQHFSTHKSVSRIRPNCCQRP